MKKQNKIKLGLPGGLLREQTTKLFLAAGYDLRIEEHFYEGYIDDPEIEIFLARNQELTDYAERGAIDAAIAQEVYILEQRAKVVPIASFDYGVDIWSNARVVLAVPKKSNIKTVKALQGKKILSRVPEITKKYLKKHKVKAKVEWTDTPAEPKVPLLGDAIVGLTSSGRTLKSFDFKIIDVLMETSPILFANLSSFKNKWKREKIENLGILLKGARVGLEMVGLMLHASNEMIEEVLKVLPALKRPTVTRLRGENWFSVFTVANKKETREIIPKLKKIGCTDIIEIPLNKVVI